MFEEKKKPLEWIFQKKHSTHFGRYRNHNSYEPKTNTAVLLGYSEGLGEALEILRGAQTALFDKEKKDMAYADIYAMGALGHAIEYLKGKGLNPQLSATRTLLDDNSPIWLKRVPDEPED